MDRNVGVVLKEYFDSKGVKQTEIASLLGTTKQRVHNLLNGTSFGKDEAQKWESIFGFSSSFLLTGKGELLPQNTPTKEMETVYFYDELPVSGGDMETFLSASPPSGSISMKNLHGAKYFFPVIGCSMQPRIKNGDWIGVSDVNNGDIIDPDKIYLIITRDNQRMIKHIAQNDDEKEIIVCVSENENYKPVIVPYNMIIGVYKVVYHIEAL